MAANTRHTSTRRLSQEDGKFEASLGYLMSTLSEDSNEKYL